MSCIVCSLALAAIGASTVLASSQVPSSLTEISNPPCTSPVAYFYGSSLPSRGKYQIHAYSAASNAKPSSIPEVPFSAEGAGQVNLVE
jgi:hypothetical protein